MALPLIMATIAIEPNEPLSALLGLGRVVQPLHPRGPRTESAPCSRPEIVAVGRDTSPIWVLNSTIMLPSGCRVIDMRR
jgi:hypothetical protein